MSHVLNETEKLVHHDERKLFSVWERWHWDDNRGGWFDPELCAKAKREEVEYIPRHMMYTRVPRDLCQRETERAPINTGWAETDKGHPGKLNVRARWVAKEYKTHARPELYASTPPLEALQELSEVATGDRGWLMCEVRSTLQHEEEFLSNCRQGTTRQVTSTCAGCCNTACTARGQPCMETPEFFIKKDIKKKEIKEQMIEGGADLEKSGRIYGIVSPGGVVTVSRLRRIRGTSGR